MKKKSFFTIIFIALVALSQFLLFSTLSSMSESNDCPLKVLMQGGDCATSAAMSDHHLDVAGTFGDIMISQNSVTAISIAFLFLGLFFALVLLDKEEWNFYRKQHYERFLKILLSLKKKYIRWLSYFNKGSIFSTFVGVNVN